MQFFGNCCIIKGPFGPCVFGVGRVTLLCIRSHHTTCQWSFFFSAIVFYSLNIAYKASKSVMATSNTSIITICMIPRICSEGHISTQKHTFKKNTHMIPCIHFNEGDRVRLTTSTLMIWWALIPACTEPWQRSIKAVADRDQKCSVSFRLREEDGESDTCYLSPLLSLMLSPYLSLYH